MNIAAIEKICSQRSDLAAYIDGELLLREEIELEAHLAVCGECRRELNEQKKLLCVLDFALEGESEIKLPENFTRIVVANAESKVSGLRRPQERSKALFVCAALFLLVLLGLGGETQTVLNTFAGFAEQFLIVIGFAFHLFYDIALGTAVILRSIGSQLIFNSTVSLALTIICFGLPLFALLRFIVRSPRLKIQAQEK
ncbi:MAG: zf-HC2 domain-containing protein [Pyrinomonadaceae bacterium]|nr:zf-HC2 domain-containing protein [Pyrinomonadaceae bacterium]